MQQQEQPGQELFDEQFVNILEEQKEGEELDEISYEQMMKEWMNAGSEAEGMQKMMDDWQKAWAESMEKVANLNDPVVMQTP